MPGGMCLLGTAVSGNGGAEAWGPLAGCRRAAGQTHWTSRPGVQLVRLAQIAGSGPKLRRVGHGPDSGSEAAKRSRGRRSALILDGQAG